MAEDSKVKQDLLSLRNPVLFIGGRIDEEAYNAAKRAIAFLMTRGSPPLKVIIDSRGGEAMSGLNIYDLIRLYENETEGTVYRMACSMASVVLQACTVRRCTRHSRILIHNVTGTDIRLDVMRKPKKLRKLQARLEERQKRIDAIYAMRSGKPVEFIHRISAKNEMMPSEKALEYGFIDEVV